MYSDWSPTDAERIENVERSAAIFYIHLRATHPIPALDLEAGENLRISHDPARPTEVGLSHDDCAEYHAEPAELRAVADGLKDGTLAIVSLPTWDQLQSALEIARGLLTARLARLEA